MRSVWVIGAREFLSTVRRPSYLVVTLGMPFTPGLAMLLMPFTPILAVLGILWVPPVPLAERWHHGESADHHSEGQCHDEFDDV